MPADCPPTSRCPPPPPAPCAQVCPPPHPPPPCRIKPQMRGLHWARTQRCLAQALLASATGGILTYVLYTKPHRERYAEFYRLAELDDWADDMARKGLFQAVPKQSKEQKK